MEAIEAAINDLAGGLEADGFELKLERVEASGVVFVGLSATPEACHDCLVPDAVLVEILETAIKERHPASNKVVLTKYGFESATAH